MMQAQPSEQQPSVDKAERILKHSAVEGLLRGMGVASDSPDMLEVIRVCGGTRNVPAEVPVERYVALMEWLARRFFPDKPLAEGLRGVGLRMFHGYRETLIGRIQLAALNVLGPDRLVRKAGEFIGRNSNFGQRTCEQLGPRHYRLRFRGVPIAPEFYCGLTLSAFEALGIQKAQVSFELLGPEDMDFDICWE